MTLSLDDFSAFFQEIHGYEPFPWQKRLLEYVAAQGTWPRILDLPTGSGKTAAIDVAVFHLALEADRGSRRSAPVRIAFVVDRRLVVDDAFARAQTLAGALASPGGPVTRRAAERLLSLACDESRGRRPLIARRLRGGLPREDDWARTPSQPTILCSTVDQIGSRLLFRGYGVSDSMKPVHAGLIGSDCLILLDEAHLAEPFHQTLNWVERYRGEGWREEKHAPPWGMALLTATPGEEIPATFALDDDDRHHPVLEKRLNAGKPARLAELGKTKKEMAEDGSETEDGDKILIRRVSAIVEEVERAFRHFETAPHGVPVPAIGVVVNRVARARAVFSRLKKELEPKIPSAEITLMIGPARPVERDELADTLRSIRTKPWKDGENRILPRPVVLVATQCIEAGVDIDLDALITEAAALDALRQRFGRLNRAGRDIVPYAAIVAARDDLSPRNVDPVYGKAIKHAWDGLIQAAAKEGSASIVDFGLARFNVEIVPEALSPKPDAPVLMPGHLDLLSQTSPIPAADPEVALYLHGPDRQPDSISVVWRADIDPGEMADGDVQRIRRRLTLVPPRSGEAVELPLWAVRRWLDDAGATDVLADAATEAPEEDRVNSPGKKGCVFVWKGNDERSRWIYSHEIRAGDAIVVPARYGGIDRFGWAPKSTEAASDVAHKTAALFKGCRFAIRIAPGLIDPALDEPLADTLASTESQGWKEVATALLQLPLPAEIRQDLDSLREAKRPASVTAYLDLYGTTEDGRPRGAVFIAPFGIRNQPMDEEGSPNATEDDTSGSLLGLPLALDRHSEDVEHKADLFAKAAGLPEARVQDLRLAGFLHDFGKADPRFQKWLHHGDPLGWDPDEAADILAKSGRPLPPAARTMSGLPDNWRHEALSVRLALHVSRFSEARDPELVLWLVGIHHGHGRPFFPHMDPLDATPRELPDVLGLPQQLPSGAGPQSIAFDWNGLDWPKLFERVKARYGPWGLAHMEAILRLADHRASEDAKENIQ